MKTMKRSLQLLALGAVVLLNMGQTHKPYTVIRFDNAPNGGSIANTATHDDPLVTVAFTDGTRREYRGLAFSSVSEAIDLVVTGRRPQEIAWIWLGTSGSDWLWIDQIEVLAGGNNVVAWRRGVDNLQGWCISNSPTDGNAVNCEPDGSTSSVTWTPP